MLKEICGQLGTQLPTAHTALALAWLFRHANVGKAQRTYWKIFQVAR